MLGKILQTFSVLLPLQSHSKRKVMKDLEWGELTDLDAGKVMATVPQVHHELHKL